MHRPGTHIAIPRFSPASPASRKVSHCHSPSASCLSSQLFSLTSSGGAELSRRAHFQLLQTHHSFLGGHWTGHVPTPQPPCRTHIVSPWRWWHEEPYPRMPVCIGTTVTKPPVVGELDSGHCSPNSGGQNLRPCVDRAGSC